MFLFLKGKLEYHDGLQIPWKKPIKLLIQHT